MTDRERPPDPGRDGALTIAARIFGNARHIPRRECLGCGGAGSRERGAVSWQCDGSGAEVNGDWSPMFRAWSDWQYAAAMHQAGHNPTDPGPPPTHPTRAQWHDWTYTFTWSQIKERAEALAVGEQVGAFDAATVAAAVEPSPTPAPAIEPTRQPEPVGQAPEPVDDAADQLSLAL